jgi:hypothetical protein
MLLESLFRRNVVRPMPSFMDNVLMAMFYNKINCSFALGFYSATLGAYQRNILVLSCCRCSEAKITLQSIALIASIMLTSTKHLMHLLITQRYQCVEMNIWVC